MKQEKIINRLLINFGLTLDLANELSENVLKLKLADTRSNKIGEQFYCIIGARESYLKSLIHKKWMGFECSLEDKFSKQEIIIKLKKSAKEIGSFFNSKNNVNDLEYETLVNILEHEVQHHGQLIRYVYGNNLEFPKSWNEKYTV